MNEEVPFWRQQAYYRNLIRLVKTDSGVKPVRFTNRQLEHFSRDVSYRLRSQCPAGVSISLFTDATWIELDIQVEAAMRDRLLVMATVEDRWSKLATCDPLGPLPKVVSFRFDLHLMAKDGKPRSVDIYLSQCVDLTITDVRLSPGAFASPPEDRRSMQLLCIGDSITQGIDSHNPAGGFAVRLARLLNAELLNQGVGGHDFDPDSFDTELSFEPTLITIAYGVNDWSKNKTASEIKENARRLLERVGARYQGVPILLITPIWHHKEYEQKAAGTLSDVRNAIAAAAVGMSHVQVVDGIGLVPGLSYLFSDGVHPTDEGFSHYAVELWRHALRALGR